MAIYQCYGLVISSEETPSVTAVLLTLWMAMDHEPFCHCLSKYPHPCNSEMKLILESETSTS